MSILITFVFFQIMISDKVAHLRLERWSWPVLLYFPIGIILLAVRLALLLEIILIWVLIPDFEAKKVAMKFLFTVMGLHVNFERQSLKKCPRIIISNKSSLFDYLAMQTVVDIDFVDNETRHLTVPPGKCKNLVKDHFGAKIKSLETSSNFIFMQPQTYISSNASAICPVVPGNLEGVMQAQLVMLKLWRPVDVSSSVGTNTSYWDALWLMFSPITVVEISFVGKIERESTVSNETFAQDVEQRFSDYSGRPVLEETEEEMSALLFKNAQKTIDLTTINEKSNEFYSKLTTSDRFTIRAEKVKEMIQTERAKYLSRKNSSN